MRVRGELDTENWLDTPRRELDTGYPPARTEHQAQGKLGSPAAWRA
jgi:hypothetical protein